MPTTNSTTSSSAQLEKALEEKVKVLEEEHASFTPPGVQLADLAKDQ